MEDEAEDCLADKEEDLGAVEEERSVILHLLSQLKLGMDLTRVGRVPYTAKPQNNPNNSSYSLPLSVGDFRSNSSTVRGMRRDVFVLLPSLTLTICYFPFVMFSIVIVN